MVVDLAKIARLEKELQEAKAQLWREDAERYRLLAREMGETDRNRILANLTDRGERILFGLEAPEEAKRGAGMRPGGSGGELECSICGKSGLTRRGLALHVVRIHKEEKEKEEVEAERALNTL
jgi:hypothetical protein